MAPHPWSPDRATVIELLEPLEPPGWHARAACREHPEVSWFPAGRGPNTTAAKAVCARCAVVDECRSWALAQGATLQGVWGGLSARERRRRH